MSVHTSEGVAEIQGLYGPFSFPEKLLQQIWARRDFDGARAVCSDGRRVRVLHPGKWNHLGGPDFRDARLELGGRVVVGDVEVHLRADDWEAHGHRHDPAYAKVILHVVLFPGAATTTRGVEDRAIPVLSLLPLLHHDLEEYAADEAVARLSGHPLIRVQALFGEQDATQLREKLKSQAAMRWEQKIHFARLRVQRLGWESACHHTALEILGYRFNRAPMLGVASAFPLEEWRRRADRGDEFVEEVFTRFEDHWQRQGVRPANHPQARLAQYARWVGARPDWPTRVAKLIHILAGPSSATSEGSGASHGIDGSGRFDALSTRSFRRTVDLSALTDDLAQDILGGEVGGTRGDTLFCDGFLPLAAASQTEQPKLLFPFWFHWTPGDAPESFQRLLRNAGVADGADWPLCHGWLQGLIGWLAAEEQKQATGAI